MSLARVGGDARLLVYRLDLSSDDDSFSELLFAVSSARYNAGNKIAAALATKS